MNAKKLSPSSNGNITTVSAVESPLKYLSASQKRRTRVISKDWKLFTHGLFGEILNKI